MPTIPGSRTLSGRVLIIFVAFLIAALALVGRLAYLQLIKAPEYASMAESSRTVNVTIPAKRGTIYDRNGNVLATSVDATTIYCDPTMVDDPREMADALAECLGGKSDDYLALITQDTTFVYVKRKADVNKAESLKEKGLSGLYFLPDSRRVYPYGSSAGQIVGASNIDDVGITGLELYYDDILSGVPGKMVYEQSATGIPIPNATVVERDAADGQDIIISIDIDMQIYMEERLSQGVADMGGSDGTAVLMDAATGEIYAIASTPYFNPGDLSEVEDGATSIKAITSGLEPGSIFKTVSATAILENGKMTPDTEVFCPAYLAVDEYYIEDMHERDDMTMTFRDIIRDSSNVGISLSVDEYLGYDKLYDKILEYGLHSATGVDYPGEEVGFLSDYSEWSMTQAYNISFGQGITCTPLQMTRFYGALRNDGVAVTPHFLVSLPQSGETPEYETEQIIQNTEAVPTMVDMLQTVVEEGTGVDAQMEGLTVVGKTGTAEFALETGGYSTTMSNRDFVGFLPNSTSSLVCYVGVDHVPVTGAVTPIFRDIMTFAVDQYRIAEQ
ncbi:peptidoglycan D,D-transpeptidase FtsI family protein [Slackia heliotrinireducens]|uniref:peptidoglycan D,D-transpeptidase FtsI family protein n=1 Tax=Slackia heliotrinireducens TaxID=84110 RepID=UPI003315A4A6